MMMYFRSFLAALFITLALPFFAPTASQVTAPALAQKVVENASDADQEIQKKVRDLFGEIDAYENVFVTVKGGVVTLKGRVLTLEQVSEATELAQKIDGVVTVNNEMAVETSVEKRIIPILEQLQARATQLISLLPIFLVGLIILGLITALGFFVAKRKFPWDSIAPNKFVADLLRQIVRIGFFILGLVVALDIIGATALLGTILGAAGILGLAIGFAVRDTVENYIASVLLSFRQPFRPRDVVKIEGYEGYVIALTSRATVLLTFDGNHVRIPNATVFKGVITNYSLNPERRFDFSIGVETEDLQGAVDLGVGVVRDLSFVLDNPAADGWISGIGDSSVTLWFGGWINQNETSLAKAKSEAIRKVIEAFAAKSITMPEPIYRLRHDNDRPPAAKKRTTQTARTKARAKPVAKDTGESDVTPDRQIEQKVAEAEERNKEADLMDPDGAQEVSS
ncbi:MAG: mechanosensitive ion channel family protein [Pseudomonadota bacterium]